MTTHSKTEYKTKFKNGLIAGAVQTSVLYPLDILHVKLFLQKPVSAFVYNGFYFTLFGNCLKRSLIFPLQDSITTHLKDNGKEKYANIACTAAGAMLGLVLTPINSIRTPLQIHDTKNLFTVTKEIYRTHGFKGFYKGGLGIMLRNAIWTYFYFPVFNYCIEKYNNKILASMSASIIATTLAYPLDGSRLYRQHHEHNHNFFYGIRKSFSPTQSNICSLIVGNIRVSLSVCIAHFIYLTLK